MKLLTYLNFTFILQFLIASHYKLKYPELNLKFRLDNFFIQPVLLYLRNEWQQQYRSYILPFDSSLFSPKQRIIRETEEEFIFPLVKKRGAIT